MRKIVSSILLIAIFTNVFAAPVAAHWRDWNHDWDWDWNWRDRDRNPKPKPIEEPKPSPNPVTPPKPVPRTPTPSPVPDPVIYGFEVQNLTLPASMGTNRHYYVPLTIKNTSSFDWKRNRTIISYRWIDSNGQYEVYRGKSTLLLKSINPNELSHAKQRLHIKAPEIPGTYTLAIDVWNDGKWITSLSNSKYEVNMNVIGKVWVIDYKPLGKINDDAQYATSPDLSIKFNRNLYFVYMWYAKFIKGFAQATSATKEEIQNGTAKWSAWQPLSIEDKTVKVAYTLENQNVGSKQVYVRFRALPRNKKITTDEYAQSMIRYGSAERTSPAFYVDEIFFDNQPPTGGVQINNNAYSTSSRTGNLRIWADDGAGSGIDAMRWTENCNMADLNANSWSEWDTNVGDRNGVGLGGGNLMSICVQIRDKAGNVSTFRDEIVFFVPPPTGGGNGGGGGGNVIPGIEVGEWSGVGIGNHDSPFANLSSNDFPWPHIEFDRFINWDGTSKWNQLKTYSIPSPVITYVERGTNNVVDIYGVGIRKFNPTYVVVNNEYRHCWACGSGWDWRPENRTVDNVKIVLYKADGTYLTELWNDDAAGKWHTQLTVGTNINEGDSIYAQLYIYQDFYFDNLRWWSNTTESNVKFSAWDLSSPKSSGLAIPPTRSQLLIQKIESFYSIDLIEDGANWSEWDLENIGLGLFQVPRSFYDGGNMVVIKQPNGQAGSGCAAANTLGYVRPNEPNNVYICTRGQAEAAVDLDLQGTIIHEFAHNWTRRVSDSNIKYGLNVVNDPDHILYKYYDKLFNAQNGEWVIDTNIVDSRGMPTTCSTYDTVAGRAQWPIYQSWYACANTFRLQDLNMRNALGQPVLPPHTMPEEELAEAIRVYYQDPTMLQAKDGYNYSVPDGNSSRQIQGNLERHNFISTQVQ